MDLKATAKRRVGWWEWTRLTLAILLALLAIAVILPDFAPFHLQTLSALFGYVIALALRVACIALGQRRSIWLEGMGWLGLLLLSLLLARWL